MEWFFATRTFHAMHDKAGGDTGVDEAFASNWGPGIGAEIMGRDKFGPQRAPWPIPALSNSRSRDTASSP